MEAKQGKSVALMQSGCTKLLNDHRKHKQHWREVYQLAFILWLASEAVFPYPLIFVFLFCSFSANKDSQSKGFNLSNMRWESAAYNFIISKSSQISTGKQIICERTLVYTIPAHQRITKAALPEPSVFVACEVLEILDVFFFCFFFTFYHTLRPWWLENGNTY